MTKNRYSISTCWKLIFSYVFILFLIVTISLLSSCGVRKVENDKSKIEGSEKESIKSEGSVKKEELTTENKETKEVKDKSDEKQEKRVIELFFENGVLKERITEFINSKSTDKSTKDKKSVKSKHTYTDSTFNNVIYRTRNIKVVEKHKSTDKSNTLSDSLGGSLVVFGLGSLAIFFMFLYFRLKMV